MSNKTFGNLNSIVDAATRRAIREALGLESTAQTEEERQETMSKRLRPFKAKSKKKASDEADDKPPEKTELIKAKQNDEPAVNLKKITDHIDILRSGKSLKDKSVRAELKDYYDRLSSNEKLALFAFLKGLARIMATGTDGAEVEVPDEAPYDIKMNKKPEPKKEKSKADDSAPIVVGETASTAREKRIIEAYKK
jgi:hypothetical protein